MRMLIPSLPGEVIKKCNSDIKNDVIINRGRFLCMFWNPHTCVKISLSSRRIFKKMPRFSDYAIVSLKRRFD